MISPSQYSVRSRIRQKQPEITIEETPEQQEQRELREFMANLDEEQEIGILQLPTFRRKSTSSENQKETKEFQIKPPSRECTSPRRHSKRTESAVSSPIAVVESKEDREKRELKELLDQLEDEVEVGLLRTPSDFQRHTKELSSESKEKKEKNEVKDGKSLNTSQVFAEPSKETQEEMEKREIKELIEQLAEEQEIGILDPWRRIDEPEDQVQKGIEDSAQQKNNASLSTERVHEEELNEEDLEKLEIQKLFKELEDEQEEGLLDVPGGPRGSKEKTTTSEEQSHTETEAEVSVQDSLVIDKANKASEEEDETLGLEESFESVDYGTLKLPGPHDWEEEERIRAGELEAKEEKKESSIVEEPHSSQEQDSIGAILDVNASDLDEEPVWHTFHDPAYGFNDKYSKETNSESSYSRSSRTGKKHRKEKEEKIAKELLNSETEKLKLDFEDFNTTDKSEKDERFYHALLQSENDKELIDSSSTEKITFQTSEERIAHFLLASENDKTKSETALSSGLASQESEESIAKALLSSEKNKENIGSTSTSKMTFQTSEERIAGGLLQSENEKESLLSNNNSEAANSEILEADEKIARALLVSENEKEKIGYSSISSASSMDSINGIERYETLINVEEKDKLSSTSASSISRQESYERIVNDQLNPPSETP